MKSFSVFRMSEACQVDTWPIETQIAMISVSGSLHQFGKSHGKSIKIQANTFGLEQWLGLIVNLNYVGYGIHRDYMRLQYLNPEQSVEIHQLYVTLAKALLDRFRCVCISVTHTGLNIGSSEVVAFCLFRIVCLSSNV